MQKNNCYRLALCLAFLSTSLVFQRCVTTYDTISNRDFSGQYSPTNQLLHAEYYLFTPSASECRLYFRFFPKELTYTRYNNDSVPKANASLFFRVTQSENSIEIIDSLTTRFPFTGNPRAQFTGFVPVRFPGPGHYFIEIFLNDLISEKFTSTVIETDILPNENLHAYMPLTLHGNPLFKPFVHTGDSFRLRCDICRDSTIIVNYFTSETRLPAPPDVPNESPLPIPETDTVYAIKYTDTLIFQSKNEGFWLFTESNKSSGKIVLNTDRYYPLLKTPDKLLEPLAYILTEKELEQFKSLNNPKIAVDSFWLMNVEELDEARELISVFYNRVQLANYYFTDYRPGWLTDMGMIYIICGPPTTVKKGAEGETWLYGQGSKGNVDFYFTKEQHPQFGVIHRLHRTDQLSRFWFSAVNTWRDGRIFNVNP